MIKIVLAASLGAFRAPGLAPASAPLAPALTALAPLLSAPSLSVPEKVTPGVREALRALPEGARLGVVVSVVQDESPLPKGDRKAKTDELQRRFKNASAAVVSSLSAMGVPYEESWLISSFKAELTAKEIDELAALPAVENVYLPAPLRPAY